MITHALTGVMLARLLGPEGRGKLAVCILWPTVLASLGSLGIKDALVYFTAQNKLTDRFFSTILGLAAIQGVLLMLIGHLAFPLFLDKHENSVMENLRLFLIFVPLNLIGQYFIGIYEGELRINYVNVLRLTVPTVNFVVTILLLITGQPSIRLIVLSHLFGNLLIVLFCLWARVREPSVSWRLSGCLAKQLFQYGIRSHLGTVTHGLNYKLDQMLISVLLPTQSLGYYVVAVSASGIANSLSNAYRLILFPTASRTKSLTETKKVISGFLVRTFLSVSAISLALFVLFPVVIPFFYGQSFDGSIRPAQILLIAAVFAAVKDILAFSHRALNNPLTAAKSEIVGFLVTGISLVVLLPTLGIVGAALASLLSYFVSCVYNLWKMEKLYDFKTLDLFKLVKANRT
jgi:O-antigen/teichoic acid export membrane protein